MAAGLCSHSRHEQLLSPSSLEKSGTYQRVGVGDINDQSSQRNEISVTSGHRFQPAFLVGEFQVRDFPFWTHPIS